MGGRIVQGHATHLKVMGRHIKLSLACSVRVSISSCAFDMIKEANGKIIQHGVGLGWTRLDSVGRSRRSVPSRRLASSLARIPDLGIKPANGSYLQPGALEVPTLVLQMLTFIERA